MTSIINWTKKHYFPLLMGVVFIWIFMSQFLTENTRMFIGAIFSLGLIAMGAIYSKRSKRMVHKICYALMVPCVLAASILGFMNEKALSVYPIYGVFGLLLILFVTQLYFSQKFNRELKRKYPHLNL